MNSKPWLSSAILPWLFLLLAATAAPRPEEALVVYLSGKAEVQIGDQRRPVRLHDRLPADAIVEVEGSSRVAVAFGSGKRYLLHERSRVRLEKEGLVVQSGKVELLKSGRRLLPPIASGAEPGESSAALRIEMRGLESGSHRRSSAVAWDSPEFTTIPVAVQ